MDMGAEVGVDRENHRESKDRLSVGIITGSETLAGCG
jgi:hypothetical protein